MCVRVDHRSTSAVSDEGQGACCNASLSSGPGRLGSAGVRVSRSHPGSSSPTGARPRWSLEGQPDFVRRSWNPRLFPTGVRAAVLSRVHLAQEPETPGEGASRPGASPQPSGHLAEQRPPARCPPLPPSRPHASSSRAPR